VSEDQVPEIDVRRLVDPELLPFLEQYPRYDLTDALLPQIRAGLLERMGAARTSTDYPDIKCYEQRIPGCDGDPDVRLLIYEPPTRAHRPALLHIHAGGHVMGLPEMSDAQHRRIAHDIGCVVVSVDYRLSPEHPYPAGLHDCLAALRWLHASAGQLAIDSGFIGVVGESAGAGMAVGLSLLVRDRKECPIKYLSLVAPMLDDRTGSNDEARLRSQDLSWSRGSNQFGWRALLGTTSTTEPEIYAAPARAISYAGLPDTFISVGSLDLFAQENLAFAAQLMQDNVGVEMHLYPGAYHGFDRVPEAQLSQQFVMDRIHALKRAIDLSA
jgi:acetyl esterase/lipase